MIKKKLSAMLASYVIIFCLLFILVVAIFNCSRLVEFLLFAKVLCNAVASIRRKELFTLVKAILNTSLSYVNIQELTINTDAMSCTQETKH